MAAAFHLLGSTLRRQLTLTYGRRLATAAWLMLTFLLIGAARADAQEVIEYYGTDALGSIRVVFAPDGTVKARSDYLPFGEEWQPATPGGPLPSQRFTGQQRDTEENLDYFNARSLQTRTGRFNAVDPVFAGLFEPQRWNRYAYALNNPLAFVDPTGLNAQKCDSGVGTILVDGVVWHIDDGTCVAGASGGSGGRVEAIFTFFDNAIASLLQRADRDPDWVRIVEPGNGPDVTDPDGVNTEDEPLPDGPLVRPLMPEEPIQDASMDIFDVVSLLLPQLAATKAGLSIFGRGAGGRAVLTGFTRHGLNRVIERGVRTPAILDAVRNPLHIGPIKTDQFGRAAQQYIGREATITVNPGTGHLVTAYRTGSDVLRKYGAVPR